MTRTLLDSASLVVLLVTLYEAGQVMAWAVGW